MPRRRLAAGSQRRDAAAPHQQPAGRHRHLDQLQPARFLGGLAPALLAIEATIDSLAKRRAEQDKLGWKPAKPRPRKVSAALKAYALLATSADKGAVRDLSKLPD